MAFSPKDSILATADHASKVCLWRIPSGERIRVWTHAYLPDPHVGAIAFSPDGEWLAWGGHIGGVYMCDVAGRRSPWMAGKGLYVSSLAVSADAQLLAVGSASKVHLLELASGKELQEVERDAPRVLTDRLSADELAGLWRDLAAADAAVAYRAVWRLIAAPVDSVPFLAEHVRPAEPLDQGRLRRLVQDLGSDQFQTRHSAMKELEKLGALAEDVLREAQDKRVSLEMQRRIEQLQKKISGRIDDVEVLRHLRAVKVLEHIGSPQARKVIEQLASGASEARLTW